MKFLSHLATGSAIVVAAAAITSALHDTSFFRRLENSNLDTWLLAKKPVVSQDIFVVLVTDDDYRNLFHATSPLDQRQLQKIAGAIAKSGARLIGVDFDTSEWDPALTKELPRDVPVVWAREAEESGGGLRLEKVLGGDGHGVCFGLPSYVPDDDGVIRAYNSEFEGIPSFGKSAAGGCRSEHEAGVHPHEHAKTINFLGNRLSFDHLPAGALLALAETAEWRKQNPLRGKIVLLGGAFKAARDQFPTPVGRMDGVDILAHTIASELPGGEMRHLNKSAFFAMDLVLGLLLVTGTWFLPRAWALLITFLFLPLLAFAASWLAFQSAGYFASFVPVLAGVFIHELIEHVREHRELLRECEELKRELQQREKAAA